MIPILIGFGTLAVIGIVFRLLIGSIANPIFALCVIALAGALFGLNEGRAALVRWEVKKNLSARLSESMYDGCFDAGQPRDMDHFRERDSCGYHNKLFSWQRVYKQSEDNIGFIP